MSMTRKQLDRLLRLALDVNGMGRRQSDETGDSPTVFISLSGHVAGVEIRVFSHGWKPSCEPDFECYFYTDGMFDSRKYRKAVAYLKGLKNQINEKCAQEAGTSVQAHI